MHKKNYDIKNIIQKEIYIVLAIENNNGESSVVENKSIIIIIRLNFIHIF